MEHVASQWLARSNEDGSAAVTELVNFILKSAGCDVEVTEDQINDPDSATGNLEDIQAQFQAVNWPP